ncbi:uncharacterized protein LOC127875192 [Dreissena polymorpha]|uniref:MAM domain-containing protein n=1 Tax=Dreissena polymorpha TaxID=45954 RepID=A0A9D4L8J3_DREPO|nr:uncharacterized protein LOC127875192 [Dreissena polymorpha]KAH3853204.1 hypothetical protein DPMN_095726 [Dreissena polymorpha]
MIHKMDNSCLIAWLLSVVYLNAVIVSTQSCGSQSSCESCTSRNTFSPKQDIKCRWCSLDNQCHIFDEFNNPCDSDMNIKERSLCKSSASDKKYNESKALMFTKLSAVAYAEPEYLSKCIKHILPNDDFEIMEAIGRKCERWFDYKECFVYTALSHRHRTILVGYRGTTQFMQLTEQAFSGKSADTDWVLTHEDGKIHRYFNFAFNRLYDPCIQESVKKLATEYKTYEIVVTGHSLGGAMASLTAYSLVQKGVVAKERMSLYTFGMPRVGDTRYAFNHDNKVPNSWRIIHWRDMVARIPPKILGYYHHKMAVLYPENMPLNSNNYTICTDNENSTCSLSITMNLEQHSSYFGINLGDYCQTTLKYKRETDEPRFPEGHCQVITLKGAGEMLNTIIINVTESTCDFEIDNCDWTKSNGSTFSFKRINGSSDSAGMTGPSFDSTGSVSGHYIYAEASGNMKQLTKLRSPNFFSGLYCFEFFYHMYGEDMGSLTLTMHSSKTSSREIFQESGDQGNQWKKVRINVNVTKWKDVLIYFEFEARIGKSYKSDIAMDSIRITPTRC